MNTLDCYQSFTIKIVGVLDPVHDVPPSHSLPRDWRYCGHIKHYDISYKNCPSGTERYDSLSS